MLMMVVVVEAHGGLSEATVSASISLVSSVEASELQGVQHGNISAAARVAIT